MAVAGSPRSTRSSLWWIALAGLALALIAATLAWRLGSPRGGETPELIGREAPDFERPDLSGGRVALSDFRDRVVLVDFWATWCGPCHLQHEILKPLYEEYRGRSVVFLGVNVGEDEQTVADFARDRPQPWPVLLDPDSSLSFEYQVYTLPTLVIVGTDGKVLFHQTQLADGPTLRRVLDRAIGAV